MRKRDKKRRIRLTQGLDQNPVPQKTIAEPVSVSFRYVNEGHKFCLSKCSQDEVRGYKKCLRMLTTERWQDVLKSGGGKKTGLGHTNYRDSDLRGVHLLPLKEIIGLNPGTETVEKEWFHDGLEIDLVTHDAKKFFGLMLKKNGYVMEQVLSPLVLQTTPEHEELKSIAADCLTKHHAHHYLGFAATQWKLFQKECPPDSAGPPRVKPLLYVYRVLLTGIHLMRTGVVEANLVQLNESFQLPYVPDLIERKVTGTEKGTLDQADLDFHQRDYPRLV